jgi:hypothetical protein
MKTQTHTTPLNLATRTDAHSLDQALLLLAVLLAIIVGVPSALVRLALALVELVEHLLGDSVEKLLGVDPEQVPGLVEAVEDGALLVCALVDVRLLELLEELKRKLVLVGQRLLTDDGLHRCGVATDGVLGVQLVGHVTVVLASVALADGGLHETRQRGEDVDWRVNTLVVKLTVDEDLALGNVTSQIGNGVGDVCSRVSGASIVASKSSATHHRWAWSEWAPA